MTEYRKDYAFMAEGPRAVTHDEQMFSGALSFCRRRYARDLAGVDLAVVGVPFDTATSGRPGCRYGPRAIRAASSNLAWCRAWPQEVDPFEKLAVVDWGDVHIDHGRADANPPAIEGAIGSVLEAGAAVLMLGGDHFTSWPSLKAHGAVHGDGLSLIQFDAHCDTSHDEPDGVDHGTLFYQAAEAGVVDASRSIQVGIRTTYAPTGFAQQDAIAVQEQGVDATVARIREVVGDNRCYISFDIDCLDPAFAPGTGTPVCGGLTTWQAKEILRRLDRDGPLNLVGMDLVEVAPAYDHAEITALAGATLALEMVALYARTRP